MYALVVMRGRGKGFGARMAMASVMRDMQEEAVISEDPWTEACARLRYGDVRGSSEVHLLWPLGAKDEKTHPRSTDKPS
jgi:hypothetical protein